MAYEEYSRIVYKAQCACGQGFSRYYKICEYNDWGYPKNKETPVEIVCNQCKGKYHHEVIDLKENYLVPDGLQIPTEPPRYGGKCILDRKEKWVGKYSQEELEGILGELKACKYIKNIKSRRTTEYVNDRWYETGKKSIKPMIAYLEKIIDEYSELKESVDQKRINQEEYCVEAGMFQEKLREVLNQSFRLCFEELKQDSEKHMQAQADLEKYIEDHKEDDLSALRIDLTYEKDFTGRFWDTLYIVECIDPQFVTTRSRMFGTEKVLVRKYSYVCCVCGYRGECVSSDFGIDDNGGYHSVLHCGNPECQKASHFEAKAMDILNKLDISYIREKSFEGLMGDGGKRLRFDFALFKEYDREKKPQIDLVIELQGPHHYEKGYYDETGEYITDDDDEMIRNGAERKFVRQIRYDQKKKEYCEQHGIQLACIKQDDYPRLEKKIIDVLRSNGYGHLMNAEQMD